MLRDILAALAGIVIAITIVFLSDQLSYMIYPLPADLDTANLEEMGRHISTLPMPAFLLVIGGRVIATFVGAIVANLIGTARAWVHPTIVGGFVFSATTAVIIAVPHPHWFSAVLLTSILLSAALAWQVARKV